jgi:beta-galactosidase GanA
MPLDDAPVRLHKTPEGGHQILLHNEPYLVIGAETHNSSFSSSKFMSDKWAPLQAAGINTILGAVCWDQIKQTEGQFDFEHLDGIIEQARDRKMHLILLWFGSFKNGTSLTYACL